MKDIFKGVAIKIISIIVLIALVGVGVTGIRNHIRNKIIGLDQHETTNGMQVVKEKLEEK